MRHLVTNGRRLQIAAGVTLVGQEGAVLAGEDYYAALQVSTNGVRFVSMDFPEGVDIRSGGSLTMKNCTSTGKSIHAQRGARLAMEDCRVFGCDTHTPRENFGDINDNGLNCYGADVTALRCVFEDNAGNGVLVVGGSSRELVRLADCIIRNNKNCGVLANGQMTSGSRVSVHGGSITGNTHFGAFVLACGSIEVLEKTDDHGVTVCTGHARGNWGRDEQSGELSVRGVSKERISVTDYPEDDEEDEDE